MCVCVNMCMYIKYAEILINNLKFLQRYFILFIKIFHLIYFYSECALCFYSFLVLLRHLNLSGTHAVFFPNLQLFNLVTLFPNNSFPVEALNALDYFLVLVILFMSPQIGWGVGVCCWLLTV